jgi:hypothetical protein
MTLQIVRRTSGDWSVVRSIGNMRVEHLDEVKAEIAAAGSHVALDVSEITLVSVGGIRFLNACQAEGVTVVNAPPYISEWMALERQHCSLDA